MRISDWSSDVCSSDLRLPKPSPPASPLPCTGGPPDSDQTSTTCSSVSSQWISTRPVSDDRAPYLAALVTNSCSSRAMLVTGGTGAIGRSEEHTSELQSLMRLSYDVFCLKKKQPQQK